MTPEQAKKLPKYTPNPHTAHLEDYVKDPKNYYKIQRALLETLACNTSHADPAEMFNCLNCKRNTLERRRLMDKFGFHNSAQYMAWRRIMETIINPPEKKKLPKYDD